MRLGGTPNWGFRPMTLPAPQRFEQADCSGGSNIQRFGGAGHRDAQLQVGRSQHGRPDAETLAAEDPGQRSLQPGRIQTERRGECGGDGLPAIGSKELAEITVFMKIELKMCTHRGT